MTCPDMEVVEHDSFPYATHRYYTIFGFGGAIPSGEYKLVRLNADQTYRTWEVFTFDTAGVGQTQPPRGKILYKRGSPVVFNGVMYIFEEVCSDEPLLCFDLE